MPSRQRLSISQARLGTALSGLALLATFAAATLTAVAGDMLRGGYTGSASGGGGAKTFTPPSLAQQRQNAKDVLARTTRAVQAAQSLQLAARKIAAATSANNLGRNPNNPSQTLPDVPNGLYLGGLVPDSGLKSPGVANPVTTWTGIAGGPMQSVSGGKTTVTVVQDDPTAILNWTSFNIGRHTALDFDQSAGGAKSGQWIAFNMIRDPSGVPSQILGSIKAQGQVYVINQNGIIFGGASQVNLHGLVASSLPINSYLVQHGLLNNPDEQFLFSALPQPAGTQGSPAFTPAAPNVDPVGNPNGVYGDVIVQAGAVLSSPSSVDHVGGRIALIGPNVVNNGTISTPDGQTILAAGLQVGFAASSDPSLRGLNAYVGAVTGAPTVGGAAGSVTNGGYIYVPEGDATLVGKDVTQASVIASTTSVTLNGRIDLLANYGAVSDPVPVGPVAGRVYLPYLNQDTGAVTLGEGSSSTILPELSSVATVVGETLAIPSAVLIQGQSIHFAADSTLLAPNANVQAEAGFWQSSQVGQADIHYFSTATSSPQVYFDSGAEINVAGSLDIPASVAQNIIPVQLLGAQLANDSQQRFGVFRGKTINIDVREQGVYNGVAWIGTPLADASGYAGLIERTAGELTVAGGTVNLHAGGSVVMQPGSIVDVSGGSIDYQGAVVNTTKVISSGHIFDISQATPDMTYDGIYTGQYIDSHSKYGVDQTFINPILGGPHFEQGYVYGGNGGTLNITAPATALDGKLVGLTAAGPRQLQLQPVASTLDISFTTENTSGAGQLTFPLYYPTPPTVVFGTPGSLPLAAPFAPGDPAPLQANRSSEVILSPDLVSSGGFGVLSIDDKDGKIIVPTGVSLDGQAATFVEAGNTLHNSISLFGSNVTIDGSITLPGGSLAFSAYDISPYAAAVFTSENMTGSPPVPVYDPLRGNFILGASASLDVSGLYLDERAGSSNAGTVPIVTSGGSVTVAASDVLLNQGSLINASGGVNVGVNGKPAYGNGGKISLSAGRDLSLSYLLGGRLTLGAELEAFSGAQGGSLSLTAPLVRIGEPAAGPDSLALSPDFFDQGGFTSFTVRGLGEPTSQPFVSLPGLVIAAGTVIDPTAENYLLEPNPVAGDSLVLTPALLPEESRTPVSLSFGALGTNDAKNALLARGDLVLGAGAVVESSPGGQLGATISFNGDTVTILGSVFAPGGSISVVGKSSSGTIFANGGSAALTTVEIGPNSVLSAAGALVPTSNAFGYNTGYVLNGGSISISGNIVAEAGALLDVSGASAVLDRLPSFSTLGMASVGSLNGLVMVPTVVESNGGFITLTGGESLFTDATLRGNAGGSSAFGGSLTIGSGELVPPPGAATPQDPTLVVTQSGPIIPSSFYAGGSAIGRAVLTAGGTPVLGKGYFAADSFESSGMDFLTLQGSVDFNGPVDLHAAGSLSVATGGFILADSAVRLTAPYVALGTPFHGPLAPGDIAGRVGTGIDFNSVPFNATLQPGSGSLTVVANVIDVGNLVLEGMADTNLSAVNGDIRGDGSLVTLGNITLKAGQVYPVTESIFNIISYDGTVKFLPGGVRDLPLSAGGTLNVYATTIDQGGTLVAPFGQINLGWDGIGASPLDPLTGAGYLPTPGLSIPIAQTVTLEKGSLTSVSAVDPHTGKALTIPYGTVQNGTAWIDPSGTDITTGGGPRKLITINGQHIVDAAGATVDIQGGGDLYAYDFVSGNGGTQDILAGNLYPNSFAVIPGYQSPVAPYGAYNTLANSTLVPNAYTANPDLGYYNPTLASAVGEQVYLAASPGLPAGMYTLLPARYGLLPGAFLVTKESAGTSPVGFVQQPDGSSVVSGYMVRGLDGAQSGQPLTAAFEVAPQSVVNQRAEYDGFSGNIFLLEGAAKNNRPTPPLPRDAGHLILNALASLTFAGHLDAGFAPFGKAGLVDISSPQQIEILDAGATGGGSGTLVLDASSLNALNGSSILVGGVRNDNGTATIAATGIEVNDSGTPLVLSDITLAATGNVTLDKGAVITAAGSRLSAAPIAIAGDGAALRISTDSSALLTRTGFTGSTTPDLVIGAGVELSGAGVTLDSSSRFTLDPTATLHAQSLALDAGQISLGLSGVLPSDGLVLSGNALQSLQTGLRSFSLLSYSSLDIYGTGSVGALQNGSPVLRTLSLQAAEIRGFNAGTVTIAAQNILLGNSSNATGPGPVAPGAGSLVLSAGTIKLGANSLAIDQYADVTLQSAGGILDVGAPKGSATAGKGNLSIGGNLTAIAPVWTGLKGSTEGITAGSAITFQAPAAASAVAVAGGAGASLSITAASVDINSNITLTSGLLSIDAQKNDLVIGDAGTARIDLSGAGQSFYDVTKYSNGGQIVLQAGQGNINIASGATVSVAADPQGGSAGVLSISAPQGTFTLDPAATLSGQAGQGGHGGTFIADVGTLGSLDEINNSLNLAGFNLSRSFRIRNSSQVVLGSGAIADAATFNVAVDAGSLDIAGEINAAGATGGMINLEASGDVTLESTGVLTALADHFNDAGQGGAVTMETTGGTLEIKSGSQIDLRVTNAAITPGGLLQDKTGTLHLRAPQISGGADLAINEIDGTILGASSIVAEGFHVIDASGDDVIDHHEAAALANANAFMSHAAAIATRLMGAAPAFDVSTLQVQPGEEIDNSQGDLVLNKDWDLSTARFGATQQVTTPSGKQLTVGVEPGILTLRAAGTITFNGSLSDGFGDGTGLAGEPLDSNGKKALWLDPLLPQFNNGTSQRSWSYNIAAGADFTAVNALQVLPVATFANSDSGNIVIGVANQNGQNVSQDGTIASAVEGNYQVIRTGAGSISVAAGQDVQLRNQFATIYTAGAKVEPTLNGAFQVPKLFANNAGTQKLYAAQYSAGGGNVSVTAGQDIIHLYLDQNGVLQDDSELETPNNWLYRRGAVNLSGQFSPTHFGDIASTTWWIDFSNFFEGIGALGGGNVSLVAGRDVKNVDALAPTNARMPIGTPKASNLVELGGGDVLVQAGNDINGGIYYVENGKGTLTAGNEILTNATRSPNFVDVIGGGVPDAPDEWLPTTLFLGKGSFDVSARGDLLLGPAVNPFLLPTGQGNSTFDNTYFSTYATSDAVNVSSLGGSVTLRESALNPNTVSILPVLETWYQNQLLTSSEGNPGAAFYQPWLNLAENDVQSFTTEFSILPGTMRVTSFSGDINLTGNLILSPAPLGTVDLLAAGALNGLQPSGGQWSSSIINLSDASPSSIYGITDPFAINIGGVPTTLDTIFTESGSVTGLFGSIQTKESLHAPGLLHAADPDPVHLYAAGGNVADLTLFSGKKAQVLASNDITDIALYVQNVSPDDISVVSAGRDIVAYDPESTLRLEAQTPGNQLAVTAALPLSGDIQISGPGTLEVLAGRNFTLGIGPGNLDGTGVGLTSIGQGRNPFLPSEGASIYAAAGLGAVSPALQSSSLDLTSFVNQFLNSADASRYFTDLGMTEPGLNVSSIADYNKLSKDPGRQAEIALQIFYIVLRDAGRDHNLVGSPGYGNYAAAFSAVSALIKTSGNTGDIDLTSREIKTESGGDISILAPGGQLTVGIDLPGTQPVDQGILTTDGGNISIYTQGNVNVGTSRIFTLRGGNEIIYSSGGNIAAGASAKTVQSAPPTRVLVDPQSADVSTDLAGLATGGGVGVLASVAEVPVGSVDLIAPAGVIDAGDAGIRATGNLNLAAVQVLNASNIQAGGASSGVPTLSVAAPNIGALSAASSVAGATNATANEQANSNRGADNSNQDAPSDIDVTVLVPGDSSQG